VRNRHRFAVLIVPLLEIVVDAVSVGRRNRRVPDGEGVAGRLDDQRDARFLERARRVVVARHAVFGAVQPEDGRRGVVQFPDELLDVGFVLEVALRADDQLDPSRRCAARPIEPSSFSVAV